jgi:hypothetical protein
MDTVIVKRAILFALFAFNIHNGYSQFATIVDIGSIDESTIKMKMDKNAGMLLTEINEAFVKGIVPSLSGIEMTADAKSAVLALWETSPFRCKETEIVDDILKLYSGDMELRNIRLFMKEADSLDKNQEGVLVFTKAGIIDNLYLAIETKQWKNVMKQGNSVTDLRRREIILDFVENFRTAYNRKDIEMLKNVFSEDALIITGKVVKVLNTDADYMSQNIPQEKIIYNRQTKSEYLAAMRRIFAANSYINIKFEELEVVQHGKYPDYYGVTIKQFWNTTRYSDVGYVFLLIDLSDEANMLIHVRTWQPNKIGGREISKNEVFNIGSFGKLR